MLLRVTEAIDTPAYYALTNYADGGYRHPRTVEEHLAKWLKVADGARHLSPVARARMHATITSLDGPCEVIQATADTFRCAVHGEPVEQEDVHAPETCAKGMV